MRYLNRSVIVGIGLLVGLTFLEGCGAGGTSYSLMSTGQTFTQSNGSFNNELDILWVVDNSSSMSPLQTNLTNNFNSFIQNFQTKGYDFKMAVTTTDAYKADPNLNGYNQNNAPLAQFRDGLYPNFTGVYVIVPSTPNLDSVFVTNATQGVNGSGDERAFSSFKTALNSNYNTGFVRSNSFFAVIILSDEDDFSSESRVEDSFTLPQNNPNYVPDHDYNYVHLDTVPSYESYLDTLTQSTSPTRRWNLNAIAVLDQTCLTQHQQQSPSSIIGQRYIQMANDTSGILGSVCDTSYATTLENIEEHIAELSTQFFLNQIPQVNTIVVTVNGSVVPQDPNNGWTYISSSNSIMFHGTAIPPQGATINVQFIPQGI